MSAGSPFESVPSTAIQCADQEPGKIFIKWRPKENSVDSYLIDLFWQILINLQIVYVEKNEGFCRHKKRELQ